MVTSMLEKAIEIEGLLRIIRDGNPLPETYKLLKTKAESLSSEVSTLTSADTPLPSEKGQVEKGQAANEGEDVDFTMATPEGSVEMATVDFFTLGAPKGQSLNLPDENMGESASVSDHSEIDLGIDLGLEEEPEDDDIILSFDDIPEQINVTEESNAPVAAEATKMATGDTEEKTAPEETASSEESQAEAEEFQTEDSTAEETKAETPQAPKRHVKLRSAFSLNDRFLYARELFNGNMKMFDSTIEFLEGVDDLAVIEEYFYSELEWNPEDANVASFMEKIRGGVKVKG